MYFYPNFASKNGRSNPMPSKKLLLNIIAALHVYSNTCKAANNNSSENQRQKDILE